MSERNDAVIGAVDREDRALVPADRSRRRDLADRVPPRLEIDPRGDPGEGVGDRVGDRQVCQPECLARQPIRVGGRRRQHDGRDPRLGGRGKDRADRAHGVAEDRNLRDAGIVERRLDARRGRRTELAGADRSRLGRVVAVAANIHREHVVAEGVEELGVRQGAMPSRFPAMDEDHGRGGAGAGSRDPPGGQVQAIGRANRPCLKGQAEVGRVTRRRHGLRESGSLER